MRIFERDGRIERQRGSGYCRLNIVETAKRRYKTNISRHPRNFTVFDCRRIDLDRKAGLAMVPWRLVPMPGEDTRRRPTRGRIFQ
jgi:hypothetical protein